MTAARRTINLSALLLACAAATAWAGTSPMSVEQGRQFWSFRPLQRFDPPAVRDSAWCRTPIDRFVRAAQEAKGLSPAPEADRTKLVRRLYFDLTGLPLAPDELKAATDDASPDWYESLVDRLLASPRYGERWGRHWLDLARFAESDGYEGDIDRPTAWNYRDFVIRALNDDVPFDRFVKWQLAGDEYAPDNPQARAATGFLAAASQIVAKDGTRREKEENRYNELDDMLSTTGSAMLGLTVGCARCHDHKFDPIPTRDYYRLLAAFTGTKRVPEPVVPNPGQTLKFTAADQLGPPLGITDAGPTPVTSYLLARADVDKKSEQVTLGFLSVLTPADAPGSPELWTKHDLHSDAKTTFQRTALAEWMTDVDRGAGRLLARVIVNRLWQHHFGEGIVRTPSDFGAQGDRPSHPELLDWLATELIRDGWRLKPIHRLILLSSAYRQDTTYDAAKAAIDPENRLLWRRRPMRAEAEVVRDSILAVSGKLNDEMYGPSVKPYIPPAAMAGRNKDGLERPKTDGPAQWRRGIYLFTKRSLPEPMLTTFDAANPASSCARRNVSTVPTQALALLNDPFVRKQAKFFAERCWSEADHDAASQVRRAYLLALSRQPTRKELNAASRFLGANVDVPSMADLCHVLFGINEFVYID